MSSNPILTACLLLALSLAAGCVASPGDPRPPLSECDYGLYWAECGGTGEPVLGCDRETGDCRWFAGGETARGYAVSDCPITDACCHEQWPFTDFAPTGRVLEHARDQLSLLGETVITRRGRSDVMTVVDLESPVRWPRITCELGGVPRFPGCESLGGGATVLEMGRSVLVRFDRYQFRVDLEITPAASLDGWVTQVYFNRLMQLDTPPMFLCSGYSIGHEFSVSGVLRLSTTDTSDLTAFHGRLDAVDERGAAFTLEF